MESLCAMSMQLFPASTTPALHVSERISHQMWKSRWSRSINLKKKKKILCKAQLLPKQEMVRHDAVLSAKANKYNTIIDFSLKAFI